MKFTNLRILYHNSFEDKLMKNEIVSWQIDRCINNLIMKISKNKYSHYQIIYKWILFIIEIFHNFLINLFIKVFEITKIKQYIKNKIFIVCHEYHIQLHLTIICISDWIERERNEKQANYNTHSTHKFVYRSFRNWRSIEFMKSLIIIFIDIANSSICMFWRICHIFQELHRFCDDL